MGSTLKRVIIESPYSGDVERNERYLNACLNDCLKRGESGYASHAIFTRKGVLDDTVPSERRLGMQAGFAWIEVAEATVVYTDLGISGGMQAGIDIAVSHGKSVEFRKLGGEWERR